MSSGRRSKQDSGKDQKAMATLASTRKKAKSASVEELSPERRVELAQQIEARRFRRKPPSI